MTCVMTWMAWCKLWPRRRHNRRKIYSLPCSLHGKTCPNIILKWLQQLVWSSFRHICLILSGCCDRLGTVTRQRILSLKTRLLILPNTQRPYWCMWRTNIVLNINVCRSLNPKTYRTTISCSPQCLLGLLNLVMINMICAVMMKNTWCLTMWLKQHPDEAIVQHTYCQPQGCIWIHLLDYHRTGGKYIRILMITTLTQCRLLVHFGYRKSLTGGGSKQKRTQSTPISPMWHAIYSLSHLTVSEWSPVFPLGEMWSDGGSQKLQGRLFTKKS